MLPKCPYCQLNPTFPSAIRTVRRISPFYRKSDGRWITRFLCKYCRRSFSNATFNKAYRQNKRNFNYRVLKLYCMNMSGRDIARFLNLSRTTVDRKVRFLSRFAAFENERIAKLSPLAVSILFDDMETFEHTKYKPLSISMAVESESRRILAFGVASMPCRGLLAATSVKRYGKRKDERAKVRKEVFEKLQALTAFDAVIKSDQNPHYPNDIKKMFPGADHQAFKGRKPADAGLGELKIGKHDPLFYFNHTAAMLRAHMCRLGRKTWCTTKKQERLLAHIALYAYYHNEILLKKYPKKDLVS